MGKSRLVIVVNGLMAMLAYLAAASALGDLIGKTAFAVIILAYGTLQAGWAVIQQALVVPSGDVAAYVNNAGEVVAGPAAGVTNGKTVDVVKTEPPASEGEMTPPLI